MRIPSSLKVIAGMWIAALLGALAGRSLAQASNAPVRGALEAPTDTVGAR